LSYKIYCVLKSADHIATFFLSVALDFLHLKGATYRLRPLWECPKTEMAATAHPFAPVIDAITTEDRVLVISGGLEGVSCWGDIIANASKVKGIRGTVIDGMCRDIDGSREVGYPVYGRNVTMISGRRRLV
jgi:hypothetical protein